jgi:hypothetical protein
MLQVKVTTQGMPVAKSAWSRVMARFADEGGKLIVESIQSLLGTAALYELSEAYGEKKQRLSGFKRVAGKDPNQPLIFSAEGIYDAIQFRREGDSIVVSVDGTAGVDEGFDYAEYWQSGKGSKAGFAGVDYLGQGLALVEDKLGDLFLDIAFEEMGL